MQKILISACLLGERVRYHGGDAKISDPILQRWEAEGRVVPLCPEVTGGLPTPRAAAELVMTAQGPRVLTEAGKDVTSAFDRGAEAAAAACAAQGIRIAILKDGSPSCGSRTIHDGSFSGGRIAGEGVTASRLRAAGVRIFTESEIDAARTYLEVLEYHYSSLETPKYRPLERFWPYADLPEEPTDEELASLDPDLHDALFGPTPHPFSITLVFPALEVSDFDRALDLARGAAEFRETGSGASHRYRVRFWPADAERLRQVFEIVGPSDATEVLIDDRPVPYARQLWLPLVWFFIQRGAR